MLFHVHAGANQIGRRHLGKLAKIMDQVRLIVVAAFVRNTCPVERSTPGECGCALETQDALKPATLRASDGGEFLYLLMPVRVA